MFSVLENAVWKRTTVLFSHQSAETRYNNMVVNDGLV